MKFSSRKLVRRGLQRNHRLTRGARTKAPSGTLSGILLLLLIFVLALLVMLWSQAIHRDTAAKPKYQEGPPLRCSLAATDFKWAGHPIYKLTNTSNDTLQNVTLLSWSEQGVPVLYVGTSVPRNLQSRHVVPQIDIDLKPHESLWLAGSLQSPYKLTVFWHFQNRTVYQVYTTVAQSSP